MLGNNRVLALLKIASLSDEDEKWLAEVEEELNPPEEQRPRSEDEICLKLLEVKRGRLMKRMETSPLFGDSEELEEMDQEICKLRRNLPLI